MKNSHVVFESEVAKVVLDKCETILEKPRTSAYSPQALVEIVYALLSISFDQRSFEKKMFLEYPSGSKPWWFSEDLDFPTATNRLKKLISNLKDDLAS
jgi:hypothetical protein